MIGANIGAHTLPIASLLGERKSIGDRTNEICDFDKLNANLKLNKNLSHCIDTYQVMLVENDNLNSKRNYIRADKFVKSTN